MSRALLLSAAALTSIWASQAHAVVTVIGTTPAAACYEAASHERTDSRAMRDCTFALDETDLSMDVRAATLVNRGTIYSNRRDYTHAMADFNEAIRLQPNLAEAYADRGIALLQHGDYRGAVDSLSRALDLGPAEPAKVYYGRAAAHEELGEVRAAYEDYRHAAEAAPQWDLPHRELTRFTVTRSN